jgi:hypothetical protein
LEEVDAPTLNCGSVACEQDDWSALFEHLPTALKYFELRAFHIDLDDGWLWKDIASPKGVE